MSQNKWVCRIESQNEDGTFNVRMSPGAVFDMEMEFGVQNFDDWKKELFDDGTS